MKRHYCLAWMWGICLVFAALPLYGQTDLAPWGNLRGIRVDGQLMEFSTAVVLVKKDGATQATGKERQRPTYQREGLTQIVTTRLDSFYVRVTATDQGTGSAKLGVQWRAHAAAEIEGLYIRITVPRKEYEKGRLQLNDLAAIPINGDDSQIAQYLRSPARSLRFTSTIRQLHVTLPEAATLAADRNEPEGGLSILIPLLQSNASQGQHGETLLRLRASGHIDRDPVTLQLDTSDPGRVFAGLGGNFRLQNPTLDPQVIDYCLDHLRVAWGRIEMPWSRWQPDLHKDPIAEARAGRLDPHVRASMEMAQKLGKRHIPIILSAWFPPAWAVLGPLHPRPVGGVWGNPLDPDKTEQIYRSIAEYILYLQEAYGVRIRYFSFNESDLGINVRQTAAAHDSLIKGLGAYLASRGLATQLLLGDNSDATSYRFIEPALHDLAARPYIGAVSFHSWRGWQKETLRKWANAADQLKVPLIVAEGSIDAQAWGYPQIFKEPSYALEEINLYVRLLAICQPLSILQWQLTSDYSPLAGGGLFGDTTPLHPTQRFWNLKQLGSTPAGLGAMRLQVRGAEVTAAALGDNSRKTYAWHIVNNGATRPVSLGGIPTGIGSLQIWITNQDQSMQQEAPVRVKDGRATFTLPATSYVMVRGEGR